MAKLLIKELCKNQGIPLKVLAEKMGMTPSVMSQFLTSPNPSIPTLERIASVLKVNIGDLFEKKYNHFTGFVATNTESLVISTKEEWVKASRMIDGLVRLPLYSDIQSLRKDIEAFIVAVERKKEDGAFMAQMGADLIVSISADYVCDYDDDGELSAEYEQFNVNVCTEDGKIEHLKYTTLEDKGDLQGMIKRMEADIEKVFEDSEYGESLI